MSRIFLSDPCVALAAADAAGMAALRPARETLEGFAVAFREIFLSVADVEGFDAKGLRAIVVASPDASLAAALSERTRLPVMRVPVSDGQREGIGLLHDAATANLPAGNGPFATVSIGEAGAKNAALFVVSLLGLTDKRLWAEWLAFRQRQTDAVLAHEPLGES